MVRLREDAANNEASSRDGPMRNSERKTTSDADEKRFARPALLSATNTDERTENTTGGNTTSHMEHDVNARANQAHTKTQDNGRPDLQGGKLMGMDKPARVAGQDMSLSRPPSKDKPALFDKDAVDATPKVCTRTSNCRSNLGLNYDTAKKASSSISVTSHTTRWGPTAWQTLIYFKKDC